MLWFNFILGSNFLVSFVFGYIKCMIMSLKQRKIKFEPRVKLNHNTYTLFDLVSSSRLSSLCPLFAPRNSRTIELQASLGVLAIF